METRRSFDYSQPLAERDVQKRLVKSGKSLNVPISYVSIPVKSDDELGVEIVEWPVLNPVDFVP